MHSRKGTVASPYEKENKMSEYELKEIIWRIIAREGIVVTNQNLDWILQKAYKEKSNEQSE